MREWFRVTQHTLPVLFAVVVLSLTVNTAQARIAREEILGSGWHDWRIVLITLVEVGSLTSCG